MVVGSRVEICGFLGVVGSEELVGWIWGVGSNLKCLCWSLSKGSEFGVNLIIWGLECCFLIVGWKSEMRLWSCFWCVVCDGGLFVLVNGGVWGFDGVVWLWIGDFCWRRM